MDVQILFILLQLQLYIQIYSINFFLGPENCCLYPLFANFFAYIRIKMHAKYTPKGRGFESMCIYPLFAYMRFAYIRFRLYIA